MRRADPAFRIAIDNLKLTTSKPRLSSDLIAIQEVLNFSIIRLAVMPRPTDRSEILARLRKVISDGGIIVGAGAGMLQSSLLRR